MVDPAHIEAAEQHKFIVAGFSLEEAKKFVDYLGVCAYPGYLLAELMLCTAEGRYDGLFAATFFQGLFISDQSVDEKREALQKANISHEEIDLNELDLEQLNGILNAATRILIGFERVLDDRRVRVAAQVR